MKRSDFCEQVKGDEAVVHLSPTDAASIRSWWSSSFTLGATPVWQQIQALQEEFNTCIRNGC